MFVGVLMVVYCVLLYTAARLPKQPPNALSGGCVVVVVVVVVVVAVVPTEGSSVPKD